MNIYLIRHGDKQEDWRNWEGLELTEKGFRQANLLGQRLRKYGIDVIYCSDMIRAIQTSEEMNKFLNVDIRIRHELREIDMGDCDKFGWDHVKNNNPDFIAEFSKHTTDIPYPNGECGQDVWNRAIKVIHEIVESKLKNVAVVSHGGVIRALISGFLGLGQERRFYIGAPPENCSISVVRYKHESNEFYVHTVNDYAHLEDLD